MRGIYGILEGIKTMYKRFVRQSEFNKYLNGLYDAGTRV